MILGRAIGRTGAAIILASALCGTGCDQSDRSAIRATVQQMDAMTDGGDGEGAAGLIAPESFAYYDRLVKLSRDAGAKEIWGLPAADQSEILRMRNRVPRKDLGALDGRGWVVHSIKQAWWHDEESWDARRIKVRGNSATCTAYVDGEETLTTLHFVRVEDRWLIDYRHVDPEMEQFVRETARLEGKTVQEVLVAWEEEEVGKPVKPDVWQPMKKK